MEVNLLEVGGSFSSRGCVPRGVSSPLLDRSIDRSFVTLGLLEVTKVPGGGLVPCKPRPAAAASASAIRYPALSNSQLYSGLTT